MSTRSPEINPEKSLSMRNCVEGKLTAFKHFYAATLALKKYIDAGDMDQIDKIIQERQQCMDIINRIDDYLLNLSRDNSPHGFSLNDEAGAPIKPLTDGIEKTLRAISVLDKECNVAAASRLDIFKQELLPALQNRQSVRNYHDSSARMPRFLDMKL